MAYLDTTGLTTFWNKIKANFGGTLSRNVTSTSIDITLNNKATTPSALSTVTLPAASSSGAGLMTTTDKATLDEAYTLPSNGIPKTDLASDVQTSLGKADTALQSHQDISGKENTSNKVTSITSSVTNTQYPSALAIKNYVDSAVTGGTAFQGTIASESALSALTNYLAGWYWIASASWTSSSLGLKVDTGNMILCTTAGSSYSASNFTVIQADIEAIPDSVINALS